MCVCVYVCIHYSTLTLLYFTLLYFIYFTLLYFTLLYLYIYIYTSHYTTLLHTYIWSRLQQTWALKLQRRKSVDTTDMDTIQGTWTLGNPKNSEASAATEARNSDWHLNDKDKQS